jgi:hypothetical protein
MQASDQIPREHDEKIFATARGKISQDLSFEERMIRKTLKRELGI